MISFIHFIWFGLMTLLHSNPFTVDSYSYLNEAKNLWQFGNTYCSKWPVNEVLPERFSFRTPGYPIFLLLVSGASLNLNLIFLAQIFVSITTCYFLVNWIDSELQFTRRQKQYFWTFCVLFFSFQFWYCRQVLTEILFQASLFFSIWNVYHWQLSRRNKSVFFASVLFSIALLVKPVLLFFIPIYLGYFLWVSKGRNKPIFLFLFIPILAWFGNSRLNEYNTGYFHYSSIPFIHSVNYYVKFSLAPNTGLDKANEMVSLIHNQANLQPNLAEKLAYLKDTSSIIVAQNFDKFLAYDLKGLLGFWIDPGRFDIYQLFGLPHDTQLSFGIFSSNPIKTLLEKVLLISPSVIVFMAINFVGGLLLFFSVVYVLFSPPLRKKYFVFLFAVIYIWIMTGGVGAMRFRLEILPFLVFFLAIAYKDFLAWYGKKSLKE